MSDYIAPGGGYQRRQQLQKSFYYPVQQPSQSQLNQLPSQGSAAAQANPAVVSVIETPPGVKLVSFQQDVTAQVPRQFQQQLQQQQMQQQQPLQQSSQQQFQQENTVPGLKNSDYAAAGWEQTYRATTPIRIVNRLPQSQSSQQQMGGQLPYQQPSQQQYGQFIPQQQASEQQMGQLPYQQFSQQQQFPQQFGQFVPQQQASQQQLGQYPPQQQYSQQQFYQGGSAPPQGYSQLPPGVIPLISVPVPPGGRNVTFDDVVAAAATSQQQLGRSQQPLQDSVYIGLPNNLFLASNRPQENYHYAPSSQQQQQAPLNRQPSNSNLLATAREKLSQTTLRRVNSEENVRTGILNDQGNAFELQPSQGPGQSAHLQARSSDYHFGALQGLNSAY